MTTAFDTLNSNQKRPFQFRAKQDIFRSRRPKSARARARAEEESRGRRQSSEKHCFKNVTPQTTAIGKSLGCVVTGCLGRSLRRIPQAPRDLLKRDLPLLPDVGHVVGEEGRGRGGAAWKQQEEEGGSSAERG